MLEGEIRIEIPQEYKESTEYALLMSGGSEGILDLEIKDGFNMEGICYSTKGCDSLQLVFERLLSGREAVHRLSDIIGKIFTAFEDVKNAFLCTGKVSTDIKEIFIQRDTGRVKLIYNPANDQCQEDLEPVDIILELTGADVDYGAEEIRLLLDIRKKLMNIDDFGEAESIVSAMGKEGSWKDKSRGKDTDKGEVILEESKEAGSHKESENKDSSPRLGVLRIVVTAMIILSGLLAIVALILLKKVGLEDGLGILIIFLGSIGGYFTLKRRSKIKLADKKDVEKKEEEKKDAEQSPVKEKLSNVKPSKEKPTKKLKLDIFEKTKAGEIDSTIVFRSQCPECEDMLITKSYSKVGRIKSTSDLFIPSNMIGRNHGEIFIHNGDIFIRDLNTLNGTFINGKRIPSNSKIRVKAGDLIKFSTYGFKIEKIG